jgi:hypothetical protein
MQNAIVHYSMYNRSTPTNYRSTVKPLQDRPTRASKSCIRVHMCMHIHSACSQFRLDGTLDIRYRPRLTFCRTAAALRPAKQSSLSEAIRRCIYHLRPPFLNGPVMSYPPTAALWMSVCKRYSRWCSSQFEKVLRIDFAETLQSCWQHSIISHRPTHQLIDAPGVGQTVVCNYI